MSKNKMSEKLTNFQEEIIEILKSERLNQRDLKTITILLNPNFRRGSDKELKEKILDNLLILEKKGIVKREKIKIDSIEPKGVNHRNIFEVWSLLIKENPITSEISNNFDISK